MADGPALLAAIADPTFDPRTEVLLSSPPPPAAATSSESLVPAGESRVVEFRPDRVAIEARLEASGYVVLVDGYDPGWQATIDGRPTPVLRANGIFRAVHAVAGAHRIAFAYRPPSVLIGVCTSAVVILGLAAAFLRRALREERA